MSEVIDDEILAGLGKTDRTLDNDFNDLKNIYLEQQKNGYQLRKALRDYLVSMKVSNEALRQLHDSVNATYEPQLGSAEKLKHLTQDSETAWDHYLNRSEKIFQNVVGYCSTFSLVREKIAKRNRKLVDYDTARHAYESVINSSKKTSEHVKKVTVELHSAKKIYEELNDDLLYTLPNLYDSRLPFILKNGQQFFSETATFHDQTQKVNNDITDLLKSSESNYRANPPKPRVFTRKPLPDISDMTDKSKLENCGIIA